MIIYFGLQTILLQNMYQNPQSAAQVADGTSKHYRQLFSPGKEPKAALHCTWLVLCRKKMNVFSKSTLYIFSFATRDQLDLQLQGFQYNLVESYLIWAFLKTTSRICPMKLGKKIFCIALCLGEVTVAQKGVSPYKFCGEEMIFCAEQNCLIFSPLFLICFSYTDKNDYITNSNSQVQGFIWMNKKEKGS